MEVSLKKQGRNQKKNIKNRKKRFSDNGNKSQVVDCNEIYTLKPYFTIFTAKKQEKTSGYEQKKVVTNKRIVSIAGQLIIFMHFKTFTLCIDLRHIMLDLYMTPVSL